ncbi:hypothetical protein FGIG_06485 [Fasciola gigantica]|uniref:Uncharacterized protein n=1 Tax=Fasciola gigantica TaxID=46835 RepID=A0A504YL26_FASGI|nr:hypothetical protein FGIG_06485 [Fasciola gigantica]
MFPSGSLSSSSPQVGPEQESLSNIPEPIPVAEKAVDSLPKSLQKQEKSRPKTFKPGKCDIFLEDVPGLVLDDAFYVDRSANREIYRHGCIYEKQVSTFKQKLKARILGFENLRLCDLFDSENSSNKKGIKKSRYFSKSNRSTMQKPPIPIPTDSTETNKEPFVSVTALSDTNLGGHSSTGDALNTCETLNRAVYDKPNDLKSWLNLLELHGKEASFLHFPETYIPSGIDFKPSDRLVVVRKQLAVAERALSANPGCLNLKVLMLRMEEMIFDLESKGAGIQSDKLSQPERLDREWAQLVFTYPQTILGAWRQLGRAIMSQGHNQRDLGLWQLYGSGYWVAGLVHSTAADDPRDAEPLVKEARRIFNTALQSHPLPTEFPRLDESQPDKLVDSLPLIAQFYGQQMAPRLELIQVIVLLMFFQPVCHLELGVFAGSGGLKHHLGCESFALQLLAQAPVGGSFVQPDLLNPVRPSGLVKAGHAFAKCLETARCFLSGLSQIDTLRSDATASLYATVLFSLTRALPILCYLYLLFDLLTSDVQCLSSCLPGFIDILAHIDRLRASLRPEPGNSSGRQTTRWSDADSKKAPNVAKCDRLCLRHFFSLAIGGLAAFAALRQRHRHPILEQLFTIWSQKIEHHINENILPPEFLFPNQLAYLLPSRAALERRLLPFSLSNVASLRGLLCPLFLAQFTHQLDSFSHQVGQVAAVTLMDQMAGGLRSGARAESGQMKQMELPYVNIYLNPSLLHGSQLELYANCLPVSMEIIRLSVELERWSSLIAGASVNEFPGCPALGKTSHCAQRVRNAFERAVRANPFFTGWLDVNNQPLHTVLLSSTPSFWAAHLRLIIWRAYMAFGWMCGSALGQPLRSSTSGNVDPRERRQAVKAVFYRAIEDLPWAKILYTDLVRYCPEDVEEVVDLLSERELRLRTPLEEVDLLLTAKPVTG